MTEQKFLFVGGPADCRGISVPLEVQTWDIAAVNFNTVTPNEPVPPSQLHKVTYVRHRFALEGASYGDVFAPAGMSMSDVFVSLVLNYKWKQAR